MGVIIYANDSMDYSCSSPLQLHRTTELFSAIHCGTATRQVNTKAETQLPPFCRWHFQMHFVNENAWISSLEISLTFVPKVWINNVPALVQIVADEATSHYLNQWWLVYWHIYASLCHNKFNCSMRSIRILYHFFSKHGLTHTILSIKAVLL